MPRSDLTASEIAQIRAHLLTKSSSASVLRELWSCGTSGTYSAYRECLQQRRKAAAAARGRAAQLPGGSTSPGGGGTGGQLSRGVAHPQSLPATVKYSFEGVKHVLAEASSAVTALAFAALRSDLLAFGCSDGELWVVGLPTAASSQTQPSCTKLRRMHCGPVMAVDWAFDNSQLLSVGRDGSLCVWESGDPSAGFPCIRSMCAPTTAFLCGRFHRVNFSLAMVGSSGGSLEVFNCSTGMLHSRYQVAGAASGLQVTALDSSNHHVFLGDSSGCLHWFTCELQGKQLSRLRPAGRLRLTPAGGRGGGGGNTPAPVTALQYVPFCRTTDTPVLMVAQQDGSLCIVRANEARHTADLYLRRVVSPTASAASTTLMATPSGPSVLGRPLTSVNAAGNGAAKAAAAAATAAATVLLRFCPSVCPLSVIQDVPLITYGSEDTSVYIVDVTARSFGGPAGAGAGRGGGAGAAAAAAAQSSLERPMTVTVLKAHRAPVTAVAWTYDEALLASADAEGMVVLWRRCRLF